MLVFKGAFLSLNAHLRKLVAVLCGLLLSASMATAARITTKSKNGKSLSKSSKSATAGRSKGVRASKSSKRRYAKRRSRRQRGQQAIQSSRAREIQQALIREKYLDGEPSGLWDAQSQEAMGRYQRDNGWQAKATPDARALIKLGLGPKHDNLLNPETAALPPPPHGNQSPVPVDFRAVRP
jgi:hypothetical protein